MVTVTARNEDGISAFVVPAGTPGMIIEPAYDKLGWHASDTHGITFADFVTLEFGPLLGEALANNEVDAVIWNTTAPQITAPWLIVHGTQDNVVPIAHARDAYAAAQEHVELIELDGTDHSFTGAGLAQMLDAVVPWLCMP
mgnify:CR=1 FL=1